MSDSINEQRCERNGLPISGCAASEYDCAKFGVCAAGPSVVTPPAQDEPCDYYDAVPEGYHVVEDLDGERLVPSPAAPSVSTDDTDEPASKRRLQPIPSSHCGNCGKPLAWRSGVGRIVITHATGDDRCGYPSPAAVLRDADHEAAQAAMNQWDADLRAEQSRG